MNMLPLDDVLLLANNFKSYLASLPHKAVLFIVLLEQKFLRQLPVVQLIIEAPFPFFVEVSAVIDGELLFLLLHMNIHSFRAKRICHLLLSEHHLMVVPQQLHELI